MRLVIEYNDSDGCTFSCDVTVPVVYESAEAFAVDFEKFCKEIHAKELAGDYSSSLVKFAGKSWGTSYFFEDGVYYAPSISTVDEWFRDLE
jgi:hypothetical protein